MLIELAVTDTEITTIVNEEIRQSLQQRWLESTCILMSWLEICNKIHGEEFRFELINLNTVDSFSTEIR